MLPLRGVYEVAINVRELARAETFYRQVLGLTVGIRDDSRRRVFLRAGGQAGMVVLIEERGAWPSQHLAFTVSEDDIDAAAAALRKAGVAVEGPVLHEWMPAKSAYFLDPDGHQLELCAPLAAAPAEGGRADPQPSIETERLLLRPFRLDDAPVVRQLAGDRAVADTTLTIPHPYGEGVAEAWIARHPAGWASGDAATFALTTPGDGVLGAIGLSIRPAHRRAEMGYWVGQPYWNRGYATEAVRALIAFGFDTLGLNRIHAHHLVRNPASGRVMQKAGMRYEGTLREHILKWDRLEDAAQYAILRADRAD